MIRLYETNEDNWCITEKIVQHNHSMTAKCAQPICWPSHKHISEYMKKFVRQLKGKRIDFGKETMSVCKNSTTSAASLAESVAGTTCHLQG
jgi:hypothetical protein